MDGRRRGLVHGFLHVFLRTDISTHPASSWLHRTLDPQPTHLGHDGCCTIYAHGVDSVPVHCVHIGFLRQACVVMQKRCGRGCAYVDTTVV